MNLDAVIANKKSYFFSLATATVIYFLFIRYFQNWLYHRLGIAGMPAGLFPSFGATFMQAEPLEAPLYVLSYLAVPILGLLLMPLISRIKKKQFISFAILAALGAGAVLSRKLLARINFGHLFSVLMDKGIGHALWFAATKRILVAHEVLLLAALSAVAIYFFGKGRGATYFSERAEKFFRRFWPVGLVLLAFLVFNPSFPVDTHHFNYYLGAVNDVYHGKAMLYETSHLYGLLDVYLLAGLFKLIPMTYPMLALIVTVCYFLMFIGIFVFVRLWLKSYTFATLAVAVILSIFYFFQTSFTRSVLFFPGMSPFRWGLYLPALFLVYQYSKTRKAKFLHAALVLSALSIFWNFDSGLYLTVATLMTFGYLALAEKQNLRAASKIVGSFLVYLVGVFVLINLLNYAVYHAWPNWHLFLRETKYFTQGAGMYPLPPVGLYEFFFFTYLTVLLVAVYRLWKKAPKVDLALLFLAAFGATSLVYYVGESTWQLLYVVTVPFILILFYAFRFFSDWNVPNDFRKLLTASFSGLLIFAGLLLCFKLPVEFSTRQYGAIPQNLLAVRAEDQGTFQDAQAIAQTFPGQRIPIMSKNDTKFLIYAGRANYFDFYYAFTIYFHTEMDKYISQTLQARLPLVLVGRGFYRNDQVQYFLQGISNSYHLQTSLQTVDIYVLN